MKPSLTICLIVYQYLLNSVKGSPMFGSDELFLFENPEGSTLIKRSLKEPNCVERNTLGVDLDRANHEKVGEFPWLAQIIRVNSNYNLLGGPKKEPGCVGSLIHKKVVLTAAHCVSRYDSDHLTVKVGVTNLDYEIKSFPSQEMYVETIQLHPNYNNISLHFDAALLILRTEVELEESPHIGFLCLAPKSFVPAEQSNCFVAGWNGGTDEQNREVSRSLKTVPLPIVGNAKCNKILTETHLGNEFDLHDSFMCAGGLQRFDTCTGDGGSSLVCPMPNASDNYYYQVGITSWGIGCGLFGVPGVYSNVAFVRDWIDKEMDKLRFGTGSYTGYV